MQIISMVLSFHPHSKCCGMGFFSFFFFFFEGGGGRGKGEEGDVGQDVPITSGIPMSSI